MYKKRLIGLFIFSPLFFHFSSFAYGPLQKDLLFAIKKGDLKQSHFLLEMGADANEDYEREYPLHTAVESELASLEIVQMLLLKGAKADTIDKFGNNPTHLAVSSPSDETKVRKFKLLASTFPDSLLRLNSDGLTPAHLAAKRANIEIFRHLIEKYPSSLTVFNWDGFTPLHLLFLSPATRLLPHPSDHQNILKGLQIHRKSIQKVISKPLATLVAELVAAPTPELLTPSSQGISAYQFGQALTRIPPPIPTDLNKLVAVDLSNAAFSKDLSPLNPPQYHLEDLLLVTEKILNLDPHRTTVTQAHKDWMKTHFKEMVEGGPWEGIIENPLARFAVNEGAVQVLREMEKVTPGFLVRYRYKIPGLSARQRGLNVVERLIQLNHHEALKQFGKELTPDDQNLWKEAILVALAFKKELEVFKIIAKYASGTQQSFFSLAFPEGLREEGMIVLKEYLRPGNRRDPLNLARKYKCHRLYDALVELYSEIMEQTPAIPRHISSDETGAA